MKRTISLLILSFISFCSISQQKKVSGQIIQNFGDTYEVKTIDFKTDLENPLKVVFDVGRNFKDNTKINPLINTAARFLNMHYNAGVKIKNLHVALVIHGSAADDILNDKTYQQKYNISNPNTPLLSALSKQGVQIILCGQTATHRNITKNEVHPDIKFAPSAMTALVQLQNSNYRLINF